MRIESIKMAWLQLLHAFLLRSLTSSFVYAFAQSSGNSTQTGGICKDLLRRSRCRVIRLLFTFVCYNFCCHCSSSPVPIFVVVGITKGCLPICDGDPCGTAVDVANQCRPNLIGSGYSTNNECPTHTCYCLGKVTIAWA